MFRERAFKKIVFSFSAQLLASKSVRVRLLLNRESDGVGAAVAAIAVF